MQGGGFDPATGYGLTATSAATSQPDAGEASITTTSGQAGISHLDSFFEQSGWTREDVLVVAAALDVVMFALIIYLEVSE